MEKEMKKVPVIRFKGFTGDWEQRKLGNVVEIGSGMDYKHLNEGDVPVYGTGGYMLSVSKALSEDKDAIGIGRKGTIDKPYILRAPFWTVDTLFYCIPKENYDLYFVNCLFQNVDWKKKDESTGVPSLSKVIINNVETSTPVYEEQIKIGRHFQVLNNLITLHQRKSDQLKKLKAYFLQNLFPAKGEKVPKIRFKGFTDDWEQRKLGEIGSTFTGLSGKTKEDFGHGDARFVTYMNVYSNSIADLAMTERVEIDQTQNSVKYGDIFFTTSSETPNEVGMSSVWLGNTENTYLNSFCFGYRPEVKVNPYYMAYMLRSPNVRNKLIILAQGISRYNISKNRVMDIEVPTPDLSEQKEIGQYFFNLDHLITLHQRKLEALQTLKKFLLQNLFV